MVLGGIILACCGRVITLWSIRVILDIVCGIKVW